MNAQSRKWLPNWRLRFVIAAVLANLVLAVWLSLPSAKPSLSAPEQPQATEEAILFKKRLQLALAKETVEESIEHLPDFNDTVPSMASLGNTMIESCPSMYAYAIRYYPNLNRVRKILEEGHSNPGSVVSILKEKLVHAMDDYKRIVEEDRKEMNSGNPSVNTRWNEFDKRRIYLSSAVYILPQFKEYNALPLMAKLFVGQEDVPKLFADQRAAVINDIVTNEMLVNRLFLFYAMHYLVRIHPRDKLSRMAITRLDEYLETTKQIPDYPEASVPSWRATFDPWDYRITILRKELGMDKQPHIRVHQFPTEIPYLEDFDAKPRPQVYKWFAKMKEFIVEAYPAAKIAPKEKGGS